MSGKRTPPDLDLFHSALKDVAPLKGRARGTKHAAPTPVKDRAPKDRVARSRKDDAAATAESAPRPRTARALEPLAADYAPTPDRRTAERLRRGQVEIEATLDLHGMTLAQAEPALARFLEQSQAMGRRKVLVVTGKGTRIDRETGRIADGAIRREFGHWLNRPANRARVIAFRAAHLRHGGGGAFYVLLKKR